MSKKYLLRKTLWWLFTCLICAAALLWIFPRESSRAEENKTVLSLWNVDTFEGGKGSRPSFLGKVAARFEKANKGVVIMVSSKTVEGAKDAIQKGDLPDMISFGSYFPYVTPLGEPSVWCRGGYALYSFAEDFSKADETNTVVSSGGANQPLVAAALDGFAGEMRVEDSTTAYVKFLNGEYTYLLGTQRDACRFLARGASVFIKPLDGFSDLQQYIAVLRKENKTAAEAFIGYLLSEVSQKSITEIGMLSYAYDVYGADSPLQNALEESRPLYTASPLMDEAAGERLKNAALSVLRGGDKEVLKNFLKGS